MKTALSYLVYWFLKITLSLRYKITVRGLEDVLQQLPDKKGLLVLPNHVAEIDPVLLMLALWFRLRPRPIVVEDFFYMRGVHFFMDVVEALPCPNMGVTVNQWKLKKLKKLQGIIVSKLKEGERFLIYPSGKLKATSQEILGGASFVPAILAEVPDLPVLMVRSTGLWGSQFSTALTGKVPVFWKILVRGIKTGFKNLIFFSPRRHVLIECQLAPREFYALKERQAINRFLEAWYNDANHGQGDQLTLVPYSMWNRELPQVFAQLKKKEHADTALLSEEKRKKIFTRIAELSGCLPENIRPEQELLRDLGLDSLDIAQLVVFLDERFHVKEISPTELEKVSDLITAVLKRAHQEVSIEALPEIIRPRLKAEPRRPLPMSPEGKTVPESFLLSCSRMGRATACVDSSSGVFSYKRLKISALILAEKIQKMPGEYVGILLPSSVGAYLSILAVQLAGKIPVMLNWTAGVKALDHAAEVTQLQTVISSIKFLTRLKDLEMGVIEDRIVLLEDLRHEIKLKDQWKGVWQSYKSTETLLKELALSHRQAQDVAVVLFTSGTEALPKGVPLSHKNLLSNQSAAMKSVGFERGDLLYGVLPPFHSFGFSVTGLLPLLSGLKVAYAPDPTDNHRMTHDIEAYHATLFCCAPSFIRGVFRVAEPSQLKTLRLVVSGAEKTPKQLFEKVNNLGTGAQLLEGYGITECSPIVTLCRPNEPRVGVGKPLEGIELCIIQPESGQILSQGVQGEVCIHGPNVFDGYLGIKRNPFIELAGKRWYRSGDLGFIAPDGSLVLAGRLKRFVKIGGEMISLGGLEEELQEIIKENRWNHLPEHVTELKGPSLALCAVEKEGEKTHLILFSVYELERDQINIALKRRGYGNLVRLSETKTIHEIPLTGTGKTHYRSLEQSLL
ncbi:MAG: AMP-binding protein [Simkania sp.]|nr:AMP-binding protein [Simkania sp.]